MRVNGVLLAFSMVPQVRMIDLYWHRERASNLHRIPFESGLASVIITLQKIETVNRTKPRSGDAESIYSNFPYSPLVLGIARAFYICDPSPRS